MSPLPTSFKGEDAKAGDPVPSGTYAADLRKVEAFDPDSARAAGKNTQAQYPSLRVDWVITDDGEFLGRHIFDNLILAAGKNFMMRRLFDAVSFPDDMELFIENPERPGEGM